MELEIMRRFLEIAREENMTKAARRLHVSQPTLSRQMAALEEEMGVKLFERKAFTLHLTREGMLLKKRARDLIDLADKIEAEFKGLDDFDGGEVHLSAAESYLVLWLAQAAGNLWKMFDDFKLHVIDCGTEEALRRLEDGLDDFALLVEPPDLSRYSYLEVPGEDVWGVLMPADHRLAQKELIELNDLKGERVFISRQSLENDLPRWNPEAAENLNIAATFNLPVNASFFVKAGQGVCLVFEHLIDTGTDNGLVFRPIYPRLTNKMFLIWKKFQILSPASKLLLDELTRLFEAENKQSPAVPDSSDQERESASPLPQTDET